MSFRSRGMSQNANQNAANSPANFPGSPTTTPPVAGGLKSALKVAVPLVALVGVVFGITYLSVYIPPKPPEPPPGEPRPGTGGPPLVFFTSARGWDPPNLSAPGYQHFPLLAPSRIGSSEGEPTASFSLSNRIFPGYFEHGETVRRTQFWFENRNDKSVTMQLQRVSCSACSGARLAAIPPETTKQLFQHTAIAALPLGAFHGFGVGLVQPAASLTQLQWTEYAFRDNPHATFHVPAATNPDKWSPQWGILELTFQVGEKPVVPLRAHFATQVDGTTQTGDNTFGIMFEAANGFELSRTSIDAGVLGPLSGDSEYQLIVYSNTRGPGSEFGDLLPPSCLVQAPAGIVDPVKFVEVTKVERIPDTGLVDVAERLASEFKRLTNVRAAYRVTIALHPKVGETRLDIGQFERTVAVTVGGVTATRQVTVKAVVRGAVWVDNDPSEIELKTFRGAVGTTEWLNLTTEKTGMELVVVPSECKPEGFEFALEKQPDRGGQGHYRLRITVPPGRKFGQFSGVVVLEVKGPNPQRIRIPFKGSSTF